MDTLFSHVSIVTMDDRMSVWTDSFLGVTDGKISYLGKKAPEEQPQTMSDTVLKAVGRRHSAASVVDVFHQAREAGFDDINMDLIAGLPADTADGFAESLRQVMALGPSNITVHTLALKKGADLFQRRVALPSQADVARMLEDAERALRADGFAPYYLYRQKYMSGSF